MVSCMRYKRIGYGSPSGGSRIGARSRGGGGSSTLGFSSGSPTGGFWRGGFLGGRRLVFAQSGTSGAPRSAGLRGARFSAAMRFQTFLLERQKIHDLGPGATRLLLRGLRLHDGVDLSRLHLLPHHRQNVVAVLALEP